MKPRTMILPILLVAWMAVFLPPAPQAAGPQGPAKPTATPAAQAPATRSTAERPMELGDILAWKSASTAILSTDGRWFAYRASPLDGDSEVVIRQTQGDKEYRFPVGEGRTGMLALSEDAKWAAFTVAPTKKEAAQLRKTRRPIQN